MEKSENFRTSTWITEPPTFSPVPHTHPILKTFTLDHQFEVAKLLDGLLCPFAFSLLLLNGEPNLMVLVEGLQNASQDRNRCPSKSEKFLPFSENPRSAFD